MLEHPAPEGLYPVDGAQDGAVHRELQSVERSYILTQIYGGLSSVGDPCLCPKPPLNKPKSISCRLQKHHRGWHIWRSTALLRKLGEVLQL